MDWLLSKGFAPEEFRDRRRRVARIIGPEAHALVQGAPRSPGMHAAFARSKQWHGDPLRAGMVIMVDPMIRLENVPHTYVRVEDTVVITEDGCERLTANSPLELDEVEALMMRTPTRFPT